MSRSPTPLCPPTLTLQYHFALASWTPISASAPTTLVPRPAVEGAWRPSSHSFGPWPRLAGWRGLLPDQALGANVDAKYIFLETTANVGAVNNLHLNVNPSSLAPASAIALAFDIFRRRRQILISTHRQKNEGPAASRAFFIEFSLFEITRREKGFRTDPPVDPANQGVDQVFRMRIIPKT